MKLSEKILGIASGSGEIVRVEEWGADVLVTGIPAYARLEGSKGGEAAARDPAIMGALALRYGLRDPATRKPIFTADEIDRLLLEEDQGVVERLLTMIMGKSKFGKAEQDAAVKGFTPAQSDATPSS